MHVGMTGGMVWGMVWGMVVSVAIYRSYVTLWPEKIEGGSRIPANQSRRFGKSST